VDTAPAMSIGQRDGPQEYLLDTLAGALRLDDGRILVLERAARLRYYDSTGVHDTTLLRRGDGPGEVRSIRSFWRYRGDSIVTFVRAGASRSAQGFSMWATAIVISARGDPGRQTMLRLTFPAGGGHAFMDNLGIEATTGTGAFLLRRSTSPTLLGSPGVRWVVEPYALLAPDGSRLDTVAVLPTVDLDELSDGRSVVPFFRRRPIPPAVHGQWMYWGNGDEFAIHVFDLSRTGNGSRQPVRIIRYAMPNPPVTTEIRERYHEFMLQQSPSAADSLAHRESHRTRPWRPTVPAFATLLTDSEGNLWAEHVRTSVYAGATDDGREAHVWTVFDSTGLIIGDVRTPDRMRVQQIGDTWLLGIWADDDNVEYVRMHRIIKRPG
jgi:hypothetical protein